MKQQRILLISTFFMLLLAAACGPVGNSASEPSAANADAPSTIEDIFATNATSDEVMDVAPIATEGESVEETAVTTNTESPTTAPEPTTKPATTETSLLDDYGIPIGFTEDGHPYRGHLDAPIVMEEFSDFQCPYCSRFANQTLPPLLENQIKNGEVLMIYYDFPLTSIHPQAMAAANAARCAGEQGVEAYWQMHDLLFADASEWSNANANEVFADYGATIGLNADSFVPCLTESKYTQQIEADISLGSSLGVRSTPSFFLNDQILVGAQPLDVFNQAIAIIQGGGSIVSEAEETAAQAAALPTPVPLDYDSVAMTLGDEDAPVRIVEFTDYQCPFCQRHVAQTMPQLLSQMIETGRVFYMLKDLPLENLHPEARIAANAARCAGEQEAYVEMHDLLFATQGEWGGQGEAAAQLVFVDLATELGLDTEVFDQCVTERRYDDLVQANMNEAAEFGVNGTPFFFIDGFPINGAQPYDLFEFAISRAEEGTLAEAYRPQEQQQQQQEQQPPTIIDVDISGSFSIGDPNAPVTIVEFTDFQCPFCARHFAQTLPGLMANYVETGMVYYVFKDLPLTQIHPQAFIAAEAARCAWDQEAYMDMHDMLFMKQGEWSGQNNAADFFISYAEQLGLDTAVFSECLNSHQHQAAVDADLQYGLSLGIRGTPTFALNGRLISGAQPLSAFEEAITILAEQDSN
ncbi:MAG: thioredoxin domain-containing protein [Ardenticatenaceae bacterium]|nr:thioredoxin domain-containing protein [Ardenticatenaceae bacterium]